MFKFVGWRTFLAGVICGAVVMAVIGAASIWWKLSPERSPSEAAMFDACLVAHGGNNAVCDAIMRMLDRERTAEAAMMQQAAQLLAAGFSKHEVVKWAAERGFVGSQLSDAVGISLEDLRAGKY